MSSPQCIIQTLRDPPLDASRPRGRSLTEALAAGDGVQPSKRLPPRALQNTCLPLDVRVPAGGYAWWYFDAESDCGAYGICVIAFVGSVFSPYYARALKTQAAVADDHIALNVVLYGKSKGWIFTEAEGFGPERSRYALHLRKSVMRRVNDGYIVDVDERQVPGYSSICGRVHFRFAASGGLPRPLDHAGEHHWWPVAPVSRVHVQLSSPQLSWHGRAYHDVNWGNRPLPEAFRRWSWLRALHPEGTVVYYVPEGTKDHLARAPFGALYRFDGSRQELEVPQAQLLPRSRWGLVAVCHGTQDIVERLEDTPFYTRAKMRLSYDGRSMSAMHEYLDVTRWQRRWVQHLLRYRMRRHKKQSTGRFAWLP